MHTAINLAYYHPFLACVYITGLLFALDFNVFFATLSGVFAFKLFTFIFLGRRRKR